MTDARAKAITQALAYIIKELVPMPRTTAGKQRREELLQDLINAGRPSKVSAADVPVGYGNPSPAPGGAASQPQPPGEGVALSVEMVMPDGPVPQVRANTVFGEPIDPRLSRDED